MLILVLPEWSRKEFRIVQHNEGEGDRDRELADQSHGCDQNG